MQKNTTVFLKGSFYIIADHRACAPFSLVAAIEKIIDCGITCVQLRMKQQNKTEILTQAKQLQTLLKPKAIPLIINDHIDVAQALDADGVHLGQNDMSYRWARQQLGPQKIIGLSIENFQQAKLYQSFDCDYFGVGPIFDTTTKSDASPAMGLTELKKINGLLSPKPVIAIGGINEINIQEVLATHVTGVALASGIFSSPSPQLACQRLSQTILQSTLLC
jgi:thiamine-phosphate pyrophosphorylase